MVENFNPRSHERSDGGGAARNQDLIVFQSTLPREERLEGKSSISATRVFQSTLPREERQKTAEMREAVIDISIHAPTRGATAILHKKFVYFYTIPTINI